MTFNDIATQFYNAGAHYSAAIQPYAIKLFFALLLVDVLVTWIQFVAEGQLDASHFLGTADQTHPKRRFRLLNDRKRVLVDERRH